MVVVVGHADSSACLRIARLEREGHVDAAELGDAFDSRGAGRRHWQEIRRRLALRQTAERQLCVSTRSGPPTPSSWPPPSSRPTGPASLPFVTLDERLARAAEREGFPVVEPA